jgi:multidrug efflux pump subunit AcrB
MNISAWAIKRPIPIVLMFVILLFLGLLAYRGLGINDNPDIDFPLIVVSVAQPGASPAELETEVTRKVEDALVGISGLDHVSSSINEGLSTTTAEFKIGTRSETALNDVRDAISKIRQTLPADINEPSITHPNFSGEPFITYAIASDVRSVAELSRLVDEDITRSLLSVSGVAQVRRSGGLTREVRVSLDPARLRALGASVEHVNQQLRALNLNLPGGRAEAGGQEQAIRTLGSARSIADLRALPITLPNGKTARLDTLGSVTDSYAEVRQMARLDGKPVVAFSVVRAQGSALVQTEEATRRQVEEMKKSLPSDVRIELIRTLADYTRAAHAASMDALYLGSILAVAVIYLFLRNWQATIISALAIPLSVIATFWVMRHLGYTLNGMTTLALTLVVGVLVDDAIVDLENIYRHIAMGKSPLQAAIEATDEIGLAIVATTFTIVAVFGPVAFMGGITGQFFRSFGITVSVAVLFSLLVARTLTPMMAAYLLPAKVEATDDNTWYRALYLRTLNVALSNRLLTMIAALGVFVGSLFLVPLIPKGFISVGDIGQSSVGVTLPAGSTIAETDRVAQAVTDLMLKRPEVSKVFATIGSSGASAGGALISTGSSVTRATINVVLVPRKNRKLSLDQFQNELRPELNKIPGARISFNQFGATGSSKPVNILLRSTNTADLVRVSDELLKQMRAMPELRDVTSTAAELRPEIQIKPDLARAAELGVSVATLGRVARLGTQGDTDFNLAKFNTGSQQLNIRVQLAETVRDDIATIGDLLIPARGTQVPLRTVAELSFGTGPVQIDRYDRARQVTFTANLTAGNLGDAVAKINTLAAIKNLPDTVNRGSVGESKIMMEVFTETLLALLTGIIFIYAVLVLLFGGFLQPLTIMMALPLSIGGALFGLLVSGKEMGLMAMIGILMLMGLVTKNSILLIEYTITARDNGLERRAALIASGKDRLRPILMTTVAMIAGMLPIALSIGEGTERLSPMAVAVIGGLTTSTLFTLVVIPAAYTYVDGFQRRLLRLFGRSVTSV